MSDLPDDIRRFIIANVPSVAQLEVLLLLRGEREKEWSPPEVSRLLYAAPAPVAAQLADLEAKGLLSVTHAPEMRYRYRPSNDDLDALVGHLAELYKDRRVAVVSLIYSEPVDKARSFADAFRIRKDKES